MLQGLCCVMLAADCQRVDCLRVMFWSAQLDMPALYLREGSALPERLRARQGPPDGSGTPPDAGAGSPLAGIVWTPSMCRMYTLVDRWACLLRWQSDVTHSSIEAAGDL